MVVIIQTRLLQLFGLVFFQHAQCDAGFQAHGLDCGNHLAHGFNLVVFGAAPCCTHAKTCGAFVLGGLCGFQHFIDGHQLFCFHASVVLGRLGAITTVFRAAACFNRQQGGQLHGVRIEMLTVYLLRLENKVVERQCEKGFNGLDAPALLINGGWGCFFVFNPGNLAFHVHPSEQFASGAGCNQAAPAL